jgi:hypothetical protein
VVTSCSVTSVRDTHASENKNRAEKDRHLGQAIGGCEHREFHPTYDRDGYGRCNPDVPDDEDHPHREPIYRSGATGPASHPPGPKCQAGQQGYSHGEVGQRTGEPLCLLMVINPSRAARVAMLKPSKAHPCHLVTSGQERRIPMPVRTGKTRSRHS